MRSRLIHRLREEAGFTLVELSVALILSGMVVGTLVTVFAAFSQNAGDASSRAEAQSQVRALVSEMVVELRQAVRSDPNQEAILRLDPDLIDFATVPVGATEPIRVVYERLDCLDGLCDFWVRRYAAASFTAGRWAFQATPYQQSLVLPGVLADEAMFHGITWSGDPLERISVASCGDAVPCTFTLVGVTVRALPLNASIGAAAPLEVREEVRLRNA